MRRSRKQNIVLLNPIGQQRLEVAFAQRIRKRASFTDCAEGYSAAWKPRAA